MTRAEWAQVMQRITANWPRHPLPDLSAAKFYDDLKDHDQATVTAGLEALFRAGREFPPTSAHILGEIAAQTLAAPPFREAWELLLWGVRRYGAQERQAVLEFVASASPVVARWAERVNIREVGLSDEGDTTYYAQQRDHYQNVMRREQRRVTHHGLPSAAVPQLRPSTPRPVGRAVAALVSSLEEGL